MDLNDIWQEHKGFILSLVTGLVLFLIGYLVIQGRFDTGHLQGKISKATRDIGKPKLYDAEGLKTLRRQGRELKERFDAAQKRVYFTPRPRYDVSDNPEPRSQYFLITEQVRREIKVLCNRADVRLDRRRGAANLGLPQSSPTEKPEILRTLVGLDLAERALTELLKAGDEALQSDRRAKGLKEISRMAIDVGRTTRRRPRSRDKGAVEMDQVRVQVGFLCGAYTLRSFLSRSQATRPPLQIIEFQADTSKQSGELVAVNLVLAAVLGKEGE